MKKILISIVLFANSILSFAPVTGAAPDTTTPAEYPKGYFRNPLGIPMTLAANFGELRANHFHMGFDIRTNQRENLPVYAAAEGYVSRVKIERSGFGHAIYITHPNGYTTLYAHLNGFYPALEAYIKEQQYADEKWEQEISFEPDQFPVAKGQFIAFSGNTGASQGPHLHFEIRDTKSGNNLNPWLFGLGLPDKYPPSIYRLYSFDRRYSTYKAGPSPIAIKGANGNYTSRDAVVVLSSPDISFGISAEDKTNAASFRFGIYQASLFIDDSLYAEFRLNDISYLDTRYVNGSIDYKTRASGGAYIQHLSRLPGNNSTIFSAAGNGTVLLTDSLVHKAEITVSDAEGNASVLRFAFRWDPFKTRNRLFADNSTTMIPGQENIFRADGIEAIFSARAFYDTVPFVYTAELANDRRLVSAVHHLHNYTIPVHDSFTVKIKPVILLSDSLKERVVMQLLSNHKVAVAKGEWENDFMVAKFRNLGTVKLLLDTTPPRVSLSGWVNGANVKNRKSISLVASDNLGEIKSFNAFADGQWIVFSRKDDSFTHIFDLRIAAGTHELKVVVEDIAGNVTAKNYKFTR